MPGARNTGAWGKTGDERGVGGSDCKSKFVLLGQNRSLTKSPISYKHRQLTSTARSTHLPPHPYSPLPFFLHTSGEESREGGGKSFLGYVTLCKGGGEFL